MPYISMQYRLYYMVIQPFLPVEDQPMDSFLKLPCASGMPDWQEEIFPLCSVSQVVWTPKTPFSVIFLAKHAVVSYFLCIFVRILRMGNYFAELEPFPDKGMGIR